MRSETWRCVYCGHSLRSRIKAPLISIEVFAKKLCFVGNYGSGCSSRTMFIVSSIMLMTDITTFTFRFKVSLTNRTVKGGIYFGTEFVVKYGHAKHEI